MAKQPSPSQRVADKMAAESQTQTARIVTKLQNEFQGNDRSNVSQATWHEIIRNNWQDPAWRAEQGAKNGEVPFVTDAMKAFGVDPNLLKDHPTAGPAIPTGPHLNLTQPIPPEAMA